MTDDRDQPWNSILVRSFFLLCVFFWLGGRGLAFFFGFWAGKTRQVELEVIKSTFRVARRLLLPVLPAPGDQERLQAAAMYSFLAMLVTNSGFQSELPSDNC